MERSAPTTGRWRGITYISWAESCSRSDHTARELGGSSHMVYAGRFGSHLSTVLLKYAAQWHETARILRLEQPSAVFVMTPPVFAALPAFWYARRRRARVVLDAHTAAFLLPRWRRFQWLQAILFRKATTTLVTNEHLAGVVRAAGGHATIVPDVPIVFPHTETFESKAAFTVAAVCSFDYDEPVGAIFEAAVRLPDVQFFVTGSPRRLAPNVAGQIPDNLTLTGFLSTPAYGGLLAGVDVVIALTTYDHTMLRGAYEAIYQATPVIVSDWPILRESFPEGAIHVDNTPAAIVEAIRRVRRERQALRAGAKRLRESKLKRWEVTRQAILSLLSDGASSR